MAGLSHSRPIQHTVHQNDLRTQPPRLAIRKHPSIANNQPKPDPLDSTVSGTTQYANLVA